LCRTLLSSRTRWRGSNEPARLTRSIPAAAARKRSARPACHCPSATPAAQPHAAATRTQARGRKEYPPGMRYVVVATLLLIIASLGSALFYMMRGRDDPRKMARALAIRVGLSVALFVLLMAGWLLGLWRPGAL
jgi:hypothetical protein